MTVSAALILLVVISAFLGFRTIFPVINPAANVSFPDDLEPKFFISEFGRKGILRLFSSSKRFSTLKTTYVEYYAALEMATTRELQAVTAAEVPKALIHPPTQDRQASVVHKDNDRNGHPLRNRNDYCSQGRPGKACPTCA